MKALAAVAVALALAGAAQAGSPPGYTLSVARVLQASFKQHLATAGASPSIVKSTACVEEGTVTKFACGIRVVTNGVRVTFFFKVTVVGSRLSWRQVGLTR